MIVIHILTVILLGVATNLDNICLGFAYGVGGKRITLPQNLIISLISGIFAFVSCGAAYLLSQTMRTAAVIVGSAILLILGIAAIIEGIKKWSRQEGFIIRNASLKETFALGVALALNCLAASFGAGLSEVAPVFAGLSVFAFSLFTIGIGNRVGFRAGSSCRVAWMDIASGAVLIILAVIELFV